MDGVSSIDVNADATTIVGDFGSVRVLVGEIIIDSGQITHFVKDNFLGGGATPLTYDSTGYNNLGTRMTTAIGPMGHSVDDVFYPVGTYNPYVDVTSTGVVNGQDGNVQYSFLGKQSTQGHDVRVYFNVQIWGYNAANTDTALFVRNVAYKVEVDRPTTTWKAYMHYNANGGTFADGSSMLNEEKALDKVTTLASGGLWDDPTSKPLTYNYEITNQVPTRPGYQFAGWDRDDTLLRMNLYRSTSAITYPTAPTNRLGGARVIKNDFYLNGSFTAPDKNTLTAVCNQEYTVYYDPNGGTGGASNDEGLFGYAG